MCLKCGHICLKYVYRELFSFFFFFFEKGEGFIGTIIKDVWTITRGGGNGGGRLGWWGGLEGKGRKLYLNNNKKTSLKKETLF